MAVPWEFSPRGRSVEMPGLRSTSWQSIILASGSRRYKKAICGFGNPTDIGRPGPVDKPSYRDSSRSTQRKRLLVPVTGCGSASAAAKSGALAVAARRQVFVDRAVAEFGHQILAAAGRDQFGDGANSGRRDRRKTAPWSGTP